MLIQRSQQARRKVARDEVSFLVVILSSMFVLGLLQNPGVTFFPGLPLLTNLDDLALVFATMACISRWRRVRAVHFVCIVLYGALIVFAFARSTVDTSTTIELARSIAVPSLLILVGLSIRPLEFKQLVVVWIILSAIMSLYMLLEIGGIRLIDPSEHFLQNNPRAVLFGTEQLPGYYIYWDSVGGQHIRAGGIILNPPIAGTFVAIGAVAAFHTISSTPLKWILVSIQLVALAGSQSRGGMVVAAIGMLLPWVVRKVGLVLGLGFITPLGLWAYQRFVSAGDSISHVDGLAHGVITAFTSPFGRGFGTAGNAVKLNLGTEEASESLIGIALAAIGLPFLLLTMFLIIALLRRMRKSSLNWAEYLGLGALLSAMFSESAGALAGASFMWIALGYALTCQPNPTAHLKPSWEPEEGWKYISTDQKLKDRISHTIEPKTRPDKFRNMTGRQPNIDPLSGL